MPQLVEEDDEADIAPRNPQQLEKWRKVEKAPYDKEKDNRKILFHHHMVMPPQALVMTAIFRAIKH